MQIWSTSDNKKFLDAALLYLLARQIVDNLQKSMTSSPVKNLLVRSSIDLISWESKIFLSSISMFKLINLSYTYLVCNFNIRHLSPFYRDSGQLLVTMLCLFCRYLNGIPLLACHLIKFIFNLVNSNLRSQCIQPLRNRHSL